MSKMKLLLITGIPGTGKTTVGNYLRDSFGYTHIDFEDGISLNRFAQDQDRFLNTEFDKNNIVITWGFVPVEEQIRLVKHLESYGFKLIWFDGDRISAFREYLKAGRPEAPFYFQMYRIEESKAVDRINPVIINTFNDKGNFKDLKEIVKEINKS